MIARYLFASALPLVFAAACSSAATDNTALEPSRDDRINTLATAACDRYGDTSSGCPGYGTSANQKYASEGDCQRDFASHASTLWPDAQCDRGQINDANFKKCESRAESYACSTGATNFFDAISALDECKSQSVCTDPAM